MEKRCCRITNANIQIGRIANPTEHVIESFKKSQLADPIKSFSDPINSSSDPIKEKLYQAIVKDNTMNYAAYAAMIGISEATVKRRLGELKKAGIITRVGSNKNGHWEIVGKEREV